MRSICGLLLVLGTLMVPATALAAAGDRPIGFGQQTSGGCAERRCICHVREATEAALLACVHAPGSGTVVFDTPGPIFIDSPPAARASRIKVPSNKTIQGPVTLVTNGVLFEIESQDNIIIRDVRYHSALSDHAECRDVTGPAQSVRCGEAINIVGDSKNIWIDHNDFSQCGEKCVEVWATPGFGPSAANGRLLGPDMITISNNIFRDSYFGVAIGVDAHTGPERLPEHERVTVYGNLFTGIFRRTPRGASGAWVHVFNNVIAHWGGQNSCIRDGFGFGPSSIGSAQMLLENNVLIANVDPRACKVATEISDYDSTSVGGSDRGLGLMRVAGNLTVNGTVLNQNNPGSVFDPHAYYSYTLLPADRVFSSVRANAGVRTGPPRRPN